MQFEYTAYMTCPNRNSDMIQAALSARFKLKHFDDLGDDRVMFTAIANCEGSAPVTLDDVYKSSAALIKDALSPHVTIDRAEVVKVTPKDVNGGSSPVSSPDNG